MESNPKEDNHTNEKTKTRFTRKGKVRVLLAMGIILGTLLTMGLTTGLLNILVPDKGIEDPSTSYQRFRRPEGALAETPDFFQWWYYCVKDTYTGESYAFCYYINYCKTNPAYEGTMFLFSAITSTGKTMLAYELLLSEMTYDPESDMNFIWGENPNALFQQTATTSTGEKIATGSGEYYQIMGNMNDQTYTWEWMGTDIWTNNASIHWNISIARIIGAMQQPYFDRIPKKIDDELGILWNTFCYDGIPSGIIEIQEGDYHREIRLNDTNRYRIYGDMNWGQNFIPVGSEDQPDKYRWGWASTSKIDPSNPANDIAIIAGIGIQDRVESIEMDTSAIFANVYNVLDQKSIQWKYITGTTQSGKSVHLLNTCDWGKNGNAIVSAECIVDQESYINYTDKWGTNRVPLHQTYMLEAEFVKIVMDFYVEEGDILRLLTPNEKGIWSNFEALSVECNTTIYAKSYNWYDVLRLEPKYSVVESFTDYTAGLEYGYATPEIEISFRSGE